MIKRKLKSLERKIMRSQRSNIAKFWIINVSSAKSEKEREKIVRTKKKEIIAGKIPGQNGSYYSDENANYFIVSPVPWCCYPEQN